MYNQEARDTPSVKLNKYVWFLVYSCAGSQHLRLFKHLILKHARLFFPPLCENYVSCQWKSWLLSTIVLLTYYDLVIKVYVLIKFCSFFESNFFLVFFYLESNFDNNVYQVSLEDSWYVILVFKRIYCVKSRSCNLTKN